MRQPLLRRNLDPGPGVCVSTLAYDYPFGYTIPEHAHGSDQLIYATHGVMEIHAGQSVWLIPPSFAVWVPSLLLHRIRMSSAVHMRTLYVRCGLVKRAATTCDVLFVSPLLRELIVEAVRMERLRPANAEQRAVRDLIALHVSRATSIPVEIRMPGELRAMSAATLILEKLSEAPSLQAICREAGLSTRTLQRLFRAQVGYDAYSWRNQVRLTRALEHLLAGCSVKQTAFAVGYSQPSAFVAAFRRTYGVTPRAWVKNARES